MKKNALLVSVLISAFLLSGCVVRSYRVDKDRVDQELSGNRGFITGMASEDMGPRKETRSIRVVEMELGLPFGLGRSAKKKKPKKMFRQKESEVETAMPVSMEEPYAMESAPGQEYEEYVVEKNDTLQKISQKFYGTTRKWKEIFEYNSDSLKSPDKLYPGKTIRIPVSSAAKRSAEPAAALEAPADYLK